MRFTYEISSCFGPPPNERLDHWFALFVCDVAPVAIVFCTWQAGDFPIGGTYNSPLSIYQKLVLNKKDHLEALRNKLIQILRFIPQSLEMMFWTEF